MLALRSSRMKAICCAKAARSAVNGAHHLGRKLQSQVHNAQLMPAHGTERIRSLFYGEPQPVNRCNARRWPLRVLVVRKRTGEGVDASPTRRCSRCRDFALGRLQDSDGYALIAPAGRRAKDAIRRLPGFDAPFGDNLLPDLYVVRTPVRSIIGMSVTCTMLIASPAPVSAQQNQFRFQEATIASVHAALVAGQLTCTQLTKLYLDRIEAYNMQGPALHAIITVNPKAMEIAAEMDRTYRAGSATVGPLHCIPVILKDNFNTFDMPTTGGNVTMRASVPAADAFTVARIRKAGALILAKANMSEFARGGMSNSSLGGQALNPYDLGRTPGGSSGGTGASIAANFAVLGTGSDTGQSIRSPASANNLVGIRPTRGLVSRDGVIPNSLTQDEVGPITRTVTDAALLLDVMAGYDPADPITAFGKAHIPPSYTQLLNADALKGAHICVMTNLFGTAERHAEVNAVMEGVIAKMVGLGATIVRFDGRTRCRQNLRGAENAGSRTRRGRRHEQPNLQGPDAKPGDAAARGRQEDG
jgi:Asp-tRNA(Asn)/Glu-tRNA(Gln) amidotransferase A subunit family amidase